MFKYLWLIILVGALLTWAVLSIRNIIKCFKENFDVFIIQDNGDWKDVLEYTWGDLEEYASAFIIVMTIAIIGGSFGAFCVYMKGAE